MQTQTNNYIVKLRDDGIIHVHYRADTKVTIEILKELEKIYSELTTIKRPYIFTGEEFVSITNEARKYAAEMDKQIPSLGSVFVAKNLAQKILAHYYYKFNKPVNPLQVVSTFEEAVDYITKNYELYPLEASLSDTDMI